MVIYERTWWERKWLETFTGIDYDNRLPRGKTYANTGRAYNIDIHDYTITARVRGSRPTSYKVEVILNQFTQQDHQLN